jgi:RimJ/RimL family protein N-acetyltransferase
VATRQPDGSGTDLLSSTAGPSGGGGFSLGRWSGRLVLLRGGKEIHLLWGSFRDDDHFVNDHLQHDFSAKPMLVGDRVLLRSFVLEEDAAALRSLLQDPEVSRLTGSDHGGVGLPPWDDAAETEMREWYGTRHERSDRLDLAVVDRAVGVCVGEVVLNQWDRGNRSCSFRIALTEAGQDRGLGTEALRLIVGYGFEEVGLHRISLGVFAFNPRARRVYEKAGFVVEGVRRDALLYDGAWVDDVVMSILAPEWERHRGHPENVR